MNTSKMRQKAGSLRKERDVLELQIMKFRKKIVEGSLYERYTQCGKGDCKCMKGKPHGPFLYMSGFKDGKNIYHYVGKKEDVHVVEGLRRYKEFQRCLEKLRKINKELNGLWSEYREGLIKL